MDELLVKHFKRRWMEELEERLADEELTDIFVYVEAWRGEEEGDMEEMNNLDTKKLLSNH